MLCLNAHAKINWTLDILGTRKDGYHLMDMLMQSVDMHDTLWIEEADTLILDDAAQSHNRSPLQGGDDFPQFPPCQNVQPQRRLIEQQNLRTADQRHTNAQPSLPTAG